MKTHFLRYGIRNKVKCLVTQNSDPVAETAVLFAFAFKIGKSWLKLFAFEFNYINIDLQALFRHFSFAC